MWNYLDNEEKYFQLLDNSNRKFSRLKCKYFERVHYYDQDDTKFSYQLKQ